MNPATPPDARVLYGMAYDGGSDRVIVFGGQRQNGFAVGTWSYDYDNDAWNQLNPPTSPSTRFAHAMAYDEESDRLILFGGWKGGGAPPLGDTWAFEFAMCKPPEGWFNPGWVWFSIPAQPLDPEANAVFAPWDVTNKIMRWNRVEKRVEIYPNDFTNLEVGEGYTMFSRESMEPRYRYTPRSGDFEIPLPAMGWSWIGNPHTAALPMLDLLIRNEVTHRTRTAIRDQSSVDPWVNWNFIYWDSQDDQAKICYPFGGGDDNHLRPWYGYRIWTNVDNLTLMVPEG
jgi:hypothetical protein